MCVLVELLVRESFVILGLELQVDRLVGSD